MVHLSHSICTCISSAVKMKFTIVATVLLGLLLTPALAQFFQNVKGVKRQPIYRRISVGTGYQILTIDSETLVAVVEDKTTTESWKTVLNYDTGYIASRVVSENVCYISRMDRVVMPALSSIAVLAEESKNVKGERVVSRNIRYVISNRRIRDLSSYGSEIYSLCRGLTTYMAYEDQQDLSNLGNQGSQVWYNPASCYRLDLLNLLGIDYCQAQVPVQAQAQNL
uniref:Gastrokine 1 n=3 Tax=Anas platyrhynchos TaxID=8839 RepID=U3J9D8_ANAPP